VARVAIGLVLDICKNVIKEAQDCLMLLGGFGIATRLHQTALRLNACL